MSTCHPGHQSENLVSRNCLGEDGKRTTIQILSLLPLRNITNLWGVWISPTNTWHIIMFCKKPSVTGRLYHMIDVAVVNAFVLYNHLAMLSGCRTISENDFRDELVLQIIEKYGRQSSPATQPGRPSRSDCRIRHGSTLSTSRRRCQYCKLFGKPAHFTQRKRPDCLGEPALCQTSKRDGHSLWHYPSFDGVRSLWFTHYEVKQQREQSSLSGADTATAAGPAGVSWGPGRPKGSINKSVVENTNHDHFEDLTTIIVTFNFKNFTSFCSAIVHLSVYIFCSKLLCS